MRLCIKLILILVILATCLEVNQAKKRGGGSSSRSSGGSRSSSSSSRSSSSSSRSSSSSSRGSSIGSRVKNVATKIKNKLKPKPKTNPNPGSSYPKQQFGTNTGSSSSGSFGSSSSSFGGSNVKPPKKESKVKKRLKQAALIGAGAYVGYKLGKLKEKFSSRKWGGGYSSSSSSHHISISSGSSIGRRPRYEFNDWNSWREADGFLCRNNDDCRWVDQNLNCEDYELDFSPAAGWFGGDTISIKGECTCQPGFRWNEKELFCYRPQQLEGSLAIGAIIGIVIASLIGMCCCCGICCLICKTFFKD